MQRLLYLAKMMACLCGVMLLMRAATGLTLTSQAVGNIVTTSTPVQFTVSGASSTVTYQLMNYSGQQVTTGTAQPFGGIATFTISALSPGYYECTCTSGGAQVTAAVGVLIDRGSMSLPRSGHIGCDVDMHDMVNSSNYQSVAQIIRLAGFPWVRDRSYWSNLEPSQDQFFWPGIPDQYVLNAYASQNIFVENMWFDNPLWSHPTVQGTTTCPDDLRDVYNFAMTTAQHYGNSVSAWEMGNEPDGAGFWSDLSDRFAGYEKAAYLGLKAGNASAEVFPGAMCSTNPAFGTRVFESMPGYADGFNWHNYTWNATTTPECYSTILQNHAPYLTTGWLAGKPIRMTEAGIVLNVEANGALSTANLQKKCQFMPRLAAAGLAAGNDKIFYFVAPHYVEGGTYDFSLLNADLTPQPAFVAYSAAANLLGTATYLGRYPAYTGVMAYDFSTSNGNMLVAWADTPTTISVPTDQASVQVANIFGARQTVASQQGTITWTVGPEATYFIGIGTPIVALLTTPATVTPASPVTPSQIVLSGHDDRTVLTQDRVADAYIVTNATSSGNPAPFTYLVDVYNFNSTSQATGTINLTLPSGWTASPSSQQVTVSAMGRVTCSFTITPTLGATLSNRIIASGNFGSTSVATTESYFLTPLPQCLSTTLPANACWLDSLNIQYVTGWPTAQANHSVGGTPITMNGVVYPHGVGVNATSQYDLELNGTFLTFSAMVGVDDGVGTNGGSVDFKIYGDGQLLADSGVMHGGDMAKLLSVNLSGVKHLKLLVTDAGDGSSYDNADWGGAFFTYSGNATITPTLQIAASLSGNTAPANALWLDTQNISTMTSGWSTAKAGTSVGGTPLTLDGLTFTHGVGTHAPSTYTYNVNGCASQFQAVVGLDTEIAPHGSVRFIVYGDGTVLADSGVLGGQDVYYINANLTGVNQMTLAVTDGGDGTSWDHADWGGACITVNPALTGSTAPAQAFWLDTQNLSTMTCGWSTAKAGTSVGGTPLTLDGVTFTRGVGTHAPSTYTYNVNGCASYFQAVVGLDAEIAPNGSVEFIVYGDGNVLADSGVLTAKQVAMLKANLTGVNQLTLVVTDGGDNNSYDHADWAGATIYVNPAFFASSAPTNSLWLDSFNLSTMTSGWATAQAGHSVSGNTLTMDGMQFSHGVGVNSPSIYALSTQGYTTKFQAVVGLDNEIAPDGSIQFIVYGDGTVLADSGVLTKNQVAMLNANLAGVSKVTFQVLDGGDNNCYDHADWCGAYITKTSSSAPNPVPCAP